MTADLELILSVDEECRTRVAFAQKQGEREVETARAARANVIETRQKAATGKLEAELEAILEEGRKRISDRRAALEAYLQRLDAAGEQQFELAAQIYARIISGVEGPAE